MNNIKKISFIFFLIALAVMSSFNNENPDYNNYKLLYESYNNQNGSEVYQEAIEIGYHGLQYALNSFSMDFNELTLSIFIFFFSTIYLIYKKLRWSFFALLPYVIFPFLLDSIQLRNTIGCSFLILSLVFLDKNILISLLLLLIASFFQKIFIFYFLSLLIIQLNFVNINFKLIVIAITLMVIALFFNIKNIQYLSDSSYFQTDTSIFTRLWFLFQITILILSSFYLLKLVKNKIEYTILKLFILTLPIGLLLAYNVEFFRFSRNFFILIYPIFYRYNFGLFILIAAISIVNFMFFLILPGLDFIIKPFFNSISNIL